MTPEEIEELIEETVDNFDRDYEETCFFQKSYETKREFVVSLKTMIEEFKYNKSFYSAFLETMRVFHLIMWILSDVDTVTNEFSDEYYVVAYFLNQAEYFNTKFIKFLSCSKEMDKFLGTTIDQIVRLKSIAGAELLCHYFQILAKQPDGRELLLNNGYVSKVHQLEKYWKCDGWNGVMRKFKDVVMNIQNSADYGMLCGKMIESNIVTRRSHEAHFSRHPKGCFLISVFELFLMIDELFHVIRSAEREETSSTFSELLHEVIRISFAYPDTKIRTGIIYDLCVNVDYIGMKLIYGFGGSSSILLTHIINTFKSLAELFQVKFTENSDDEAGETVLKSRVQVEELISKDGYYEVDKKYCACSDFLFITTDSLVNIEDKKLKIKSGQEVKTFKLLAFNEITIAKSSLHSTLFIKLNKIWNKWEGGSFKEAMLDKMIGKADWSIWRMSKD